LIKVTAFLIVAGKFMKPFFKIYIFFAVIFLASCSGMREIERKDILGRVSAIVVYDGAKIEKINEITYNENSFNPASIIYKKDQKGQLVPFKEENYIYQYNNLKSISFYIYSNNKKIRTGLINYNYHNNNLKNVAYYTLDEKTGVFYMFAFDSYEYDENYKLTSRRLIEYDFQAETKENTQIAQYVFTYDKEKITEMKTSILDKSSNKVIEKKEKNPDIIENTFKNIVETCNLKVRNRDFNK